MALEHEDNQEEISKDDFLDGLISEIDRLLEEDGGLNKFQSQFDNFCFKVENYGAELDKYHQASKNRFYDFAEKNSEAQELLTGINKLSLNEQSERISKIKQLYIEQCQTPPIDNPMWILHGWMKDYVAEDDWVNSAPLVYRPSLLEMPLNPVFWFFSEMDIYFSGEDQVKQPDKKELLMCDFVRLAVIHDESCEYNKSIMIYKNKNYDGKFERDGFAKDLWETYQNPKNDNFKRTNERMIKQALEHVKADVIQCETSKKKERDNHPTNERMSSLIEDYADTENFGSDIFIVHGHDETAKKAVARLIRKLELKPIILHEQPNAGRTVIEKFEDYSNVGFAVVLMTPDDIGQHVPPGVFPSHKGLKKRARQNVIFELGFFIGKLGRKRVCALYKEGVELPSDYQGVLYVPMDKATAWELELAKEIKAAGLPVDLKKIM